MADAPADIQRFLANLSPAQETVVLLRDIKALLEKLLAGDDQRPIIGADGKPLACIDLVKNIEPTETPFMKSIGKGKKR